MAFRTLSFDTRAAIPTDGFPATAAYVSSAAHKIHNVYVTKENASDLTLDMTLNQLKTDIFGDSLTFALLADKPMTFGSPSTGSDVQTWKSWYKPANSIGQSTSADRPSYYNIPMGGAAGGPAIVFAQGEFMDLPSANFHFTASTEFTIFAALETVTRNSSREAYLLGGTNSTRADLLSIWGIDNDKCAIYDNASNDSVWTGTEMASDSIRMLSHHTDGTVWDYHNGIEELEDTSTFTNAFNFNFINQGVVSTGTQGEGTFWIRELLVYNESIDTMGATQRQLIEGYLGHKWGTYSSLRNANGSTGHPYVFTDPRDGNGDYTVRQFSSPMSTIVSGFSEASVPALTEVGASVFTKEAWASPGLSVAADQVVQFVVEDMSEPGIVYIKIEFTEV